MQDTFTSRNAWLCDQCMIRWVLKKYVHVQLLETVSKVKIMLTCECVS